MASRLFEKVASLGKSLSQGSRNKTRFIDFWSYANLLVHFPPLGAYIFLSCPLQQGNMVLMVQNMMMMQVISHFFRGLVLVKVLFPLTNGFNQIFQRGLDLSTLETSYVTNVSWYFLVMFGLLGCCLSAGPWVHINQFAVCFEEKKWNLSRYLSIS